MSCLQQAASEGDMLLTRFLLEHETDVNFDAHEDGGRTALQSAVENGASAVVECLLDAGADIQAAPAKNDGVTILEALAKCTTFSSHARLGTKTPLQLAAYLDEMEAARLLLRHGADANARPGDEYGRTALQAATCNSKGECGHEMLQLLLSFEADVNAPPARIGGLTALQAAAISGDLGIAKMLLERGADINAPAAAEDGRTAIEGAAEHGRLDMVEFLLENGAKGDPETGFSRAIELAEAEVHFGVAKVLREHVAMSALLDFDLAHVESSDLIGPLPSPGFVFSDEAMEGFNFEMPS
ncbi:ankyrin repeat-containing domain protein [Colletotrichum lupini]|nr:ankyrin repeat-containing domain protein [Colletotrichum lupini]